MKIALIGSRWFAAQMLRLLLERGDEVAVVGVGEDDQLVKAAREAGVPVTLLENPRRVEAEQVPNGVDVVMAAHSHAFIGREARAKAKRAAIGYHPSLLPRHRGIAAVEWTIASKDPIAGGTVYHLSETMDGGAIAAQDWCFVYPDDDANTLWRRALAPMGLKLLMRVVEHIDGHGYAEAREQDPKAVTLAPAIRADQTVAG
jgi:methionyl-tRNA formyltransferase